MTKKGIVVLLGLTISIAISLVLIFGFWLPYTQSTRREYEDAVRDEQATRENLAQAYANMPWALEEIFDDIDHQVAIGTFDGSVATWLKTRITELRNSP